MSSNDKIPYEDGLIAGTQLVSMIHNDCEKILIVGSVRRTESWIGDVELLCIPKVHQEAVQMDFFGGESILNEPVSQLDLRLKSLWGQGKIRYGAKNGPRQKEVFVTGEYFGVKIEIYSASREQWGLYSLMRTGPAAFSRQIVTPANAKTAHEGVPGLIPAGITYAEGRYVDLSTRKPFDTSTERKAFAVLGLDYIEPHERRMIV